MGDTSILKTPLFPGDHWLNKLEEKCRDIRFTGGKWFDPNQEDREGDAKLKKHRGRLNAKMYNALKVSSTNLFSTNEQRFIFSYSFHTSNSLADYM